MHNHPPRSDRSHVTDTRAEPTPSRRERQRRATFDEIVSVSRDLLRDPGGLSLRAVAQRMGMTAPALYRYVGSYQELVYLVADSIDRDVAQRLAEARDRYPADDPAARIVAAAVQFRGWALSAREEFGLLFTNPVSAHSIEERDEVSGNQIAEVFRGLFLEVFETYRFPIPSVGELDADVVQALREPYSSAIPCTFDEEILGLGWVFMRAWVALSGTVTLEVYGHLDPNIIASGAMFRTLLFEQSQALGFGHEVERLLGVVEQEPEAG